MNKYELENRLIDFSYNIIRLSEALPKNKVTVHLSDQIVRSGTSVALNYGEAVDAESRKDFIHKSKIILKELRETMIALKLIDRFNYLKDPERIPAIMDENNQLISIFVCTIKTAKRNIQ
jgi:four helix bundle protein